MALESPLKKDIEQALRDLDHLQRLYNIYFGGGEEEPPTNQRNRFNKLMDKIKAQIPAAVNSADRFQANALANKYQVYSSKWDKTLRMIDAGTLVLPKKRK